MMSLYATWTGLIKYQNPQMPLLHVNATFEADGSGGFHGIANEELLILPDALETAFQSFDVVLGTGGDQFGLSPWGNVTSTIFMGDLPDIVYPKWGLAINFVKMPDQLTGYPVLFKGAFNAAADQIVGVWNIVEGDTPCNLPLNMKNGNFTFSKPRARPVIAPPAETPMTPVLHLA